MMSEDAWRRAFATYLILSTYNARGVGPRLSQEEDPHEHTSRVLRTINAIAFEGDIGQLVTALNKENPSRAEVEIFREAYGLLASLMPHSAELRKLHGEKAL